MLQVHQEDLDEDELAKGIKWKKCICNYQFDLSKSQSSLINKQINK